MSTGNGLFIRRFRRTDLTGVLELANLSFAEEFQESGFDPNRIEKLVDQIFGITGRVFLTTSRFLGVEPFRFFIAEVARKVVGATMVSREGKVAYVSTVMVHPDFRRRGIARMLVGSALEYSKSQKMKRAILHVIPTNSPAKNLYVDLGFKEFEKNARFALNAERITPPESLEGINISPFRSDQTKSIFDLIRASEDPRYLEIFDFKKSDLRTSLFERLFHSLSTRMRFVAIQNMLPIGYVEASYTTAQEAGRIGNVQVLPDAKGKGVEEMLIYEGVKKITTIGVRKIIGTASSSRPEVITAMERLGFKKYLDLDGMFLQFR